MANFKYHLEIKEEWRACDDGQITNKDLALAIVKKLKALDIHDSDLESIIDDFEILVDQDEVDADDFDDIWNQLYDWADQEVAPFGMWPRNKMMWVKTI